MNDLKEASHTFASYSFATYCEELTRNKRNKYVSENFVKEDAFGPDNGCCHCQGTGWIPVSSSDMDDPYRHLWVQAEIDSPSDDGWHLVPCKECAPVSDGLDEHIVKQGDKYTLKSKKSGKDLGTYDSKAGAEKREKQVEYFRNHPKS